MSPNFYSLLLTKPICVEILSLAITTSGYIDVSSVPMQLKGKLVGNLLIPIATLTISWISTAVRWLNIVAASINRFENLIEHFSYNLLSFSSISGFSVVWWLKTFWIQMSRVSVKFAWNSLKIGSAWRIIGLQGLLQVMKKAAKKFIQSFLYKFLKIF